MSVTSVFQLKIKYEHINVIELADKGTCANYEEVSKKDRGAFRTLNINKKSIESTKRCLKNIIRKTYLLYGKF